MTTDYNCISYEAQKKLEEKYSAPMPWIGLYVAAASLVCTLAMAADAFHGLRHRKLWFPCNYFTLNAASLTVIAVAMKLPLDLNNSMPEEADQAVKLSGTAFMCVMMANFMPSIGLMSNIELLTNITALCILVITVAVNVCIEISTSVVDISRYPDPEFVVCMLWILVFFCSSAFIVPVSKKILQRKYHELHILLSDGETEKSEMSCTVDVLIQHASKYWIMAETSSPQFVIACSPNCSASGAICPLVALYLVLPVTIGFINKDMHHNSDYKWSVIPILVTQTTGVLVGSIAPIFRCFNALNFKLSLKWSKKYLSFFEIEKYWIQSLVDWKRSPIPFYIGGLKCRKLVHDLRNLILNFLIVIQTLVVVVSKTIQLLPIFVGIIFFYCWHGCTWIMKTCRDKANSSQESSESEPDLSLYVLRLQDEVELASRILRSLSKAMTRLIQKADKRQPSNLLNLLQKSTGFRGVAAFDNDEIPLLHSEQPPQKCWSLVVVNLTSIAISLPSIKRDIVDQLLHDVSEALLYVSLIEEITDAIKGDIASIKKAAVSIWLDVELYGKWVDNDLRKLSRKGKSSEEILQWLGDISKDIVMGFEGGMIGGLEDDSLHKFIVANSMYRISQTVLLDYKGREGHTDEALFEQLRIMIADILAACLTNLPRVITMKCHTNVIEKREESVKTAARLIGQTKEMLKFLQQRELPSFDLDRLLYIDEWHALINHQNPSSDIISSSSDERLSSSSSQLLGIEVVK